MNFEWFLKENLFNKLSILAAIVNILFIALSLLAMAHLTGFPQVLTLCWIVLLFAGIIFGLIGSLKDSKDKKRPSKAATIALALNIAVLLLGIIISVLGTNQI